MEHVIIYGNGPVASTIYYRLTEGPSYRVEAFTVDREVMDEPELLGRPVIPFDDIQRSFPPDRHKMLVAVGYLKTNRLRADRYQQAAEKGYSFITYLSPRAVVCPDLSIGDNCLIGANTVIQASVTIGDNVAIRDNVFVGHDATIEDHTYIGSGAVVLGRATIEAYCLIGANATIKDGIRVGAKCIIGAGVTLLHDAGAKQVYASANAQRLPLSSDQL